jgi:hypothetical protein
VLYDDEPNGLAVVHTPDLRPEKEVDGPASAERTRLVVAAWNRRFPTKQAAPSHPDGLPVLISIIDRSAYRAGLCPEGMDYALYYRARGAAPRAEAPSARELPARLTFELVFDTGRGFGIYRLPEVTSAATADDAALNRLALAEWDRRCPARWPVWGGVSLPAAPGTAATFHVAYGFPTAPEDAPGLRDRLRALDPAR